MLDYSLPIFSPQNFYGVFYLNCRIFSFYWHHVVAAIRSSLKMSSHTSNPTPAFIIQCLIRHNDFSYLGATPPSGPRPPHIDYLRSHSDTLQSVGILWRSDQLYAETSIWQYTTVTIDGLRCPRRDSSPHSQEASGRRPTQGHWNRQA